MPGTIGTIIVGMGATALTLGFVTNGACAKDYPERRIPRRYCRDKAIPGCRRRDWRYSGNYYRGDLGFCR
jgi:hypothetical protein